MNNATQSSEPSEEEYVFCSPWDRYFSSTGELTKEGLICFLSANSFPLSGKRMLTVEKSANIVIRKHVMFVEFIEWMNYSNDSTAALLADLSVSDTISYVTIRKALAEKYVQKKKKYEPIVVQKI